MVIGLRRALHFYVVDDPQNNECLAGFVRFEELCTMEKCRLEKCRLEKCHGANFMQSWIKKNSTIKTENAKMLHLIE